MPLSVDLEATIDEQCAEILHPSTPLGDDEFLEPIDFEEACRTLPAHESKLRALRIVGDEGEWISTDQLRRFLVQPAVADLEVLMLPECKLGPEGGEALAAAVLPKLRLLDVRKSAIGDVGARALAAGPLATSLEYLSIADAKLSVQGFQALLDSPLGKRKASLHVEEEDPVYSLVTSLMERLYELGKGDDAAVARAFARLLEHPALTSESRDELRYQWDLIMSN